MTTDFEKQDDEHFYIEPSELLQKVYTRIFVMLQRQYPQESDRHLEAINKDRHHNLAPVTLTNLAYQTKDFLARHAQKLMKNKKTAEMMENWMNSVEDFVYQRGLTQYNDWADVQEVIVSKTLALRKEDEKDEEVDEEQEERKEREARERIQGYQKKMEEEAAELESQFQKLEML